MLETYDGAIVETNTTKHQIVSFPKSGRTWLRFALHEYFVAMGVTTTVDIRDHNSFRIVSEERKRVIPPTSTWFSRWRRKGDALDAASSTRLCKGEYRFTHFESEYDDFTPETFRRELARGGDGKLVFLLRDPRAVCVSMFYERKYRSLRDLETPEDLGEFVRSEKGLTKVVAFYNMIAEIATNQACFILTYEAMHRDFNSTFSLLLHYLFGAVDDTAVDVARVKASFDSMRRQEIENSRTGKFKRLSASDLSNVDTYKTRKGEVDGWKNELDQETKDFVSMLISEKLDKRFGY